METIPEKIPTERQEEIGRVSRLLFSIGRVGRLTKILFSVALTIVFVSAFFSFLSLPPSAFPKDATILVEKGASLGEVSLLLKNGNTIRSRGLFELCARVTGGDKPIVAGRYLFKEPISVCAVAFRIVHGISGIPAIRVTIPEGMSNKEIALLFASKLPKFDSVLFLEQLRNKEGYLFPDTYFFTGDTTTEDIEMVMNENFNKKTEPLKTAIEASKHSLSDIIIMASILEKEATTEEDKGIVSGILWKRISKGMPLQVDATFMYLLGKKSSEITAADLKMKSAYNTYRNKGLPAGPIGNPGIIAIRAAINPSPSPYFYYLSDDNGVMHYAKTFAEHVANKAKYLKNN